MPCHARKHRFGSLFSHPISNSQTSFLLNPYDSLSCDIKHSILATNQKSVPTHKLQTQQRKIANQSFPVKTQGPDRRCGIPGLNQEFSTHTHTQTHTDGCHTQNVATHHTISNDDEAAQQPGCNLDHKRSPHLSHEIHKRAIEKKTQKPSRVLQNGQKRVPNTGAVRKDLPSDKYRRSRSESASAI